MPIAEQILETLHELAPEQQAEVLDFAAFLRQRPRVAPGRRRLFAIPRNNQHGTRKRGFRVPSFSAAWATETGGASCPARATPNISALP